MSSRGRDGGYWLVKSPTEITIFDVVSSIDDHLFINECLRDDRPCQRNHTDHPCAVHKELERIQSSLVGELNRYSLAEIIASGG